MTSNRRLFLLALLLFTTGTCTAVSQSSGSAVRSLELSTFVQLGDTYTGLGRSLDGLGGRNLSFTAGADLGFYHRSIYVFSGEVRGTYPLFHGYVDGQKSILGGLRIDARFRAARASRVRPYIDLLAGAGDVEYVGGYQRGMFEYLQSSSAVMDLGGGFEVAFSPHWAAKADAQFQHWNVPVTDRGVIFAKQGSGGLVYRFGAGERPR